MLKAFERALNPCKPSGLRVGLVGAISEPGRETLQSFLCWGILSLGVITLSFALDGPVGKWLTIQSPTAWKTFALYASKAGEGWVVAVVGILGTLVLFLTRRFQASRAVFLVGFTGLMTGATATIIRSLLGRTRPDSHELQGFYGVWFDSHCIFGKYEFGAFPSGHAATVVGLAAAAWLINRRLGIVAACYALLVCWSRIALKCHHFSDIVAATVLGIYGAHFILLKVGPIICTLSQRMERAWMRRRSASNLPSQQD